MAGNPRERAAVVQFSPLPVRDVAVPVHPDVHELIRPVRRRHREEELVREIEDRGVRTDGYGNRERRRQDQERLTRERATRVAQVLQEVRQEGHATGIPALFLDAGGRTERSHRSGASVRGAHPGGDVLGSLFVEVQLNLATQRSVEITATRQRTQPQRDSIDPSMHCLNGGLRPAALPGAVARRARCPRRSGGCARGAPGQFHTVDDYSTSRTTRPMPVDSRSQLSSSRASCFRPAAVNE